MYLGPNEVLLNMDVDFDDNLHTDDIEACIDQIEKKIKEVEAMVRMQWMYVLEAISYAGELPDCLLDPQWWS